MGTVGRQDPRDDDDLDRLPPLDGDAPDVPEAPVGADDELGATDDEGGLDDSTPASDGRNLDIDAVDLADAGSAERGWLEEASDNQAVDIGGYDLVDGSLDRSGEKRRRTDDGVAAPDEADDTPEPDDDFSAEERVNALDLSAEDGPVDADEELREQDLPALDADEQDVAGDDAALIDDRLARGEGHEPVGVPWSAIPWPRVGAPVGLRSLTALACVPRGALVAWRSEGRDSTLFQVDLEGTKQIAPANGLGPGAVSGIDANGSMVGVLVEGIGPDGSENGGLFLSRNSAETFEALDSSVDAGHVALTAGRFWTATRGGGLVSLATAATQATDRATPPATNAFVRHEVPGHVTALAADGLGGIVALAVDARRTPAALVRGAVDGSIRWEGVELPHPGPLPRAEAPVEAIVAARGPWTALALGGAVFRLGAEGWQRAAWDGTVTALSFVDDDGTLLAATYSPSDSTTALVNVDAAGRPAVVALVGAGHEDPDSDGRVAALAWDEARGVVWLAGAFGIAAFARPAKV